MGVPRTRTLVASFLLASLGLAVAFWSWRVDPRVARFPPGRPVVDAPDISGSGPETTSGPPLETPAQPAAGEGGSEPEHAGGRALRVGGRVVDLDGGPVARAAITVLGAPRVRTASAPDGSFRLPPVPLELVDVPLLPDGSPVLARPDRSAGRIDLRVHAAGFATATAAGVPLGTSDLTVALAPESSAAGHAGFEDGAPAAGLEVRALAGISVSPDPFSRAYALRKEDPPVATAACGADGRFTLRGIGPGEYSIVVSGPGAVGEYLPGSFSIGPGEPPLELVVRRGKRLAARVVDAQSGEPLAGVPIQARPRAPSLEAPFAGRTGPLGMFGFDSLPDGPLELWIGPFAPYRPARLAVAAPDALPPEIALAEGRTARGRIAHAGTRAPVAGAKVVFLGADGGRDPLLPSATSDASGVFALAGLPGEAGALEVSAPGFITVEVEERPPFPSRELSLLLEPAGAVDGRVVDRTGRPVMGARVRILDAAGGEALESAAATSGADGSFRLTPPRVFPGARFALEVRHPAYPPPPLATTVVEDPALGAGGIEVVLPEGGAVSGRIAAGDGPVAGAPVRLLVSAGGRDEELHHEDLTDGEGTYLLSGILPGEYALRVDATGWAPAQTERFRVLAGEVTEYDLVLEPERVVEGRVRDTGGRPLIADVEAVDVHHAGVGRARRSSSTGAAGAFRIGSLHDGEYRLIARAPGYSTVVEENVRPPAALDIVLHPMAALEGLVTEEATGRPVRTFAARLIPSRAGHGVHDRLPVAEAEAPDGRFVLEGVPPGPYRLRVTAPGFVPREVDVDVSGGGADSFAAVALARGASVRVAAQDSAGSPVAGASVRIHPGPGNDGPATAVERTDAEGRAELAGLAPGRWFAELSHPEYLTSRSQPFEVGAGETVPSRELELVLTRGAAISGIARARDGRPRAGGTVVLLGAGTMRSAPLAADGSYRFTGLEPGKYRLRLREPFGAGSPAVDVRVERAGTEVLCELVAGDVEE